MFPTPPFNLTNPIWVFLILIGMTLIAIIGVFFLLIAGIWIFRSIELWKERKRIAEKEMIEGTEMRANGMGFSEGFDTKVAFGEFG